MIISGVSIPAPVCGYIQTSFHYSGSHAGFQLLFRHFSMVFRPVCNSFFPGLGQGQPPDLRRAPFQEQTGALPHGGAGGHHVVHQQDAQCRTGPPRSAGTPPGRWPAGPPRPPGGTGGRCPSPSPAASGPGGPARRPPSGPAAPPDQSPVFSSASGSAGPRSPHPPLRSGGPGRTEP